MLEYKREDEVRLIQNIILGIAVSCVFRVLFFLDAVKPVNELFPPHPPPPELKPKGVVVNMIPGLPAYILFMCIRHADYLNDEAKLKSLMDGVIAAVKKVISVRPTLGAPGSWKGVGKVNGACCFQSYQKDAELLSFWLSNTHQLLNCLKQYSGEEVRACALFAPAAPPPRPAPPRGLTRLFFLPPSRRSS